MQPLFDVKFEKVFPSSLDASRFAADATNAFWSEIGLSAGLATQLELCIVEMVNNAYIHAYDEVENLPITVRCHFIQGTPLPELHLEIEDSGSAMTQAQLEAALANDFIEADPNDESTWTTSGRGFLIVSSLMDRIALGKENARNQFLMVKELSEDDIEVLSHSI
ncbi:ATP-binding protein [Vibrio sp. SM6]|uniref:ATP-binding protein n=1 Tax=Vibrio agarilyticus TaxID=2726741 RepID=A0A7X8TNK0_9VIBR|nr:ATP-binding protein [Vibrio agarilyticus]NLS12036.1 ATP-binding protein [Vibrio agarilyticus]